MKQILLIIMSLISILTYSQVYPLNTEGKIDKPNGSYFKDLNGELDPYVGMWKGNWDGKTIYIQLKKIKYFIGTNGEGIYQDRVLGERKVIEADGSISIDRISNFDNQRAQFYGINFKFSDPSQKQFYFATGICGKTANIDVTFLDTAKTQMSLHLIYNPSIINDSCPYYDSVMQGNDFPINFPKDIVLTKQ